MISEEVEEINRMINKIRGRGIDTVEIEFYDKGNIKKVKIKRKTDISDKVKSIKIDKPDLSHIDVSDLEITSSDLSDFDLHESNFKNTRIINTNLAGSYLRNTDFYGSNISQTDLSNSYGFSPYGTQLTGSVDLYNTSNNSVYQSSESSNDWGAFSYGQSGSVNNPKKPSRRNSNY